MEGRTSMNTARGQHARCLECAKLRNPMNVDNASALTLTFFKKIAGNIWLFLGNSLPLHPLTNQPTIHPAEIAQLVEHNLAKVRVASSSLVFRSKEFLCCLPSFGVKHRNSLFLLTTGKVPSSFYLLSRRKTPCSFLLENEFNHEYLRPLF